MFWRLNLGPILDVLEQRNRKDDFIQHRVFVFTIAQLALHPNPQQQILFAGVSLRC